MSEFYVKLFSQKYNLEYFIFRIFNVYGPRMVNTKYGQVIPELIKKACSTEKVLSLIGSGEETRSFCYIDDHVQLTINAILHGKSKEIYNLGNPEETSINEVVKVIELVLDKKLQIVPSTPRSGDHNRRCPSIKKLLSTIGNYEFISLIEGIKKMV